MLSFGPDGAGELEGSIKARTLRGGRVVEFVEYLVDLDALRCSSATCALIGNLVVRTISSTLSSSDVHVKAITPRFWVTGPATSGA